jgi:hypothetical protein
MQQRRGRRRAKSSTRHSKPVQPAGGRPSPSDWRRRTETSGSVEVLHLDRPAVPISILLKARLNGVIVKPNELTVKGDAYDTNHPRKTN